MELKNNDKLYDLDKYYQNATNIILNKLLNYFKP